uniref:CRIB domain-containing protein RIC7-like n=1 Tax=Erigeron canadensis TaxID=72917 RepID=UPI001CB99038|nr:CRIB domain-containing protein RIC7-like [Erigeron canadensis]
MLHTCIHFHLRFLSVDFSFIIFFFYRFYLYCFWFLPHPIHLSRSIWFLVYILFEFLPTFCGVRSSDDLIMIQSKTPSKMNTYKVKGLLKGLRYISQVFDEDKKQEIQIGAPTDVKHVAHIGCDGPSEDSPSWMREFGTPVQCQSTTSSHASEAPSDGHEWVSEDSGQKMSRRERQDRIKSRHRRHRSVENAPDPDSQTKPRQPRRHHTRGAEGRCSRDESLPEAQKRTRKKKPKDELGKESSRLSRSNADDSHESGRSDTEK